VLGAGHTATVIVVGIDGSESAQNALAWALAEARLRRADVRAVCAWQVTLPAFGAAGLVTVDPGLDDSFERAAEQVVDETLDALADAAEGIHVERSIIRGSAPEVLVEASRSAELLVVGSRGHGGFAGLLLGSVSQQCAQHAPCPVVIVKHVEHAPR
jgi:nucleotide-binding universal stress UspA family protein